jgi:hypothetical protein
VPAPLNAALGINMKYITNSQFQNFEFHGSPISKIEIASEYISIGLEFVYMRSQHSDNPTGKDIYLSDCILTFYGVIQNKASVYNDATRLFEAHTDQLSPIEDEIMEITCHDFEQSLVCYTLKGFHSLGWSEWEIIARNFELSWSNV